MEPGLSSAKAAAVRPTGSSDIGAGQGGVNKALLAEILRDLGLEAFSLEAIAIDDIEANRAAPA